MSEWISVNERLPNKGQRALVFRPLAALGGDDKITVAEYTCFVTSSKSHGWSCYHEPTHWVPLPEAPTV